MDIRGKVQSLSSIIDGAIIDSFIQEQSESIYSILIRGKNITITNPETFVKYIRLAKNMKVSMREDETVEVIISYDNS